MPRAAQRPLATEDICVDDRTRHLADVPGWYFLDHWRQGAGRKVDAFACRIQRISPERMSLTAPFCGEPGERVTTHFEEFGVLRGKIQRTMGFGFVLTLRLSRAEREKLAHKVHWFEQHRNKVVTDQRRHKRIMPRNPQSSLILADGSQLTCFVIDMSASGAAVSADILPDIGTPLALGRAVGRVVRHLKPGFAIRFVEPQPVDALEARLIKPASERILL